MYVTLKLDDNGCCRIHSVSDDGPAGAPWEWVDSYQQKVCGYALEDGYQAWQNVRPPSDPGPCVAMTLTEAVDSILNQRESKAKERERREREREEIEKKRKEYYEVHMKEETERLNKLVDWYTFKLDEIREAPVDSRPRKLEKLYQISEKNKHLGVTITGAGTLNPVNHPGIHLNLMK